MYSLSIHENFRRKVNSNYDLTAWKLTAELGSCILGIQNSVSHLRSFASHLLHPASDRKQAFLADDCKCLVVYDALKGLQVSCRFSERPAPLEKMPWGIHHKRMPSIWQWLILPFNTDSLKFREQRGSSWWVITLFWIWIIMAFITPRALIQQKPAEATVCDLNSLCPTHLQLKQNSTLTTWHPLSLRLGKICHLVITQPRLPHQTNCRLDYNHWLLIFPTNILHTDNTF